MKEAVLKIRRMPGGTLLLLGFLLLIINHLSVIAGNPWLIPECLQLP